MQLNIYLISHPIIQILSNNIICQKGDEAILTNNYKKIGLLLIYEATRKWVKINNTYIKKFHDIHEMKLLDSNSEYYIFTNISKTYKMLVDIQLFLPKTHIINLNNDNQIVFGNTEKNKLLNTNSKNKKAIIFENILQEPYIIPLIKAINQYILAKNIKIICLACYDKTLGIIGNHYPELQIYTTKIIK